MMHGYNFTARVRKVLAMAREEAARLHHEYVGTEHILLGLLREGEGVATTVLENLGIDVEKMAARVDETVKLGGPAAATGPDLPYTSRAKKVLEFAMAEARGLNHAYVGTEHVLLGLLREEKGIGAQLLAGAGLTLDAARSEILIILGADSEDSAAGPRQGAGRLQGLRAAPAEPTRGRVQAVLSEAEAVANRLGAGQLEAVHVAAALLRHGEGVANVALERMGVGVDEVMAALEPLVQAAPRAAKPQADLRHSPALQRALVAASQERDAFRASALETHHLLLGLLRSQADIAAAFALQAATADRLRAESRRIVG